MRKNDIIKLGKLRLKFIRSSTVWVHKRLLLWELIVEAMLKLKLKTSTFIIVLTPLRNFD